MAKQLNVSLSMQADTSRVRNQLQDLQRQLTNLVNTPTSKLPLEAELQGATRAAAELKVHLQAATNVQTGNLDFAKLNQSIKQSGSSLDEYMMKLRSMGPAGQQAFTTLANSVAQAEIPVRRASTLLTGMWTTLKNTARWQLSSSILHGFIGGIQSAYGYAQDLNESLNNIRIVTGQSSADMAKFAKEANKAAKALSATTTEYTNASLIYYQQGLSDSEVKERTDITIKMANVARQSAEEVSDQLTSVWNNFYDGTKTLEYYADVMTALGAATASSTDEIAGGLEKFAAIGNTIGLSYEYAASALATITSNTRESEEVVGTALKTIFARIQGLQLGETLDDGTTLNKYSKALETVGINIFTTTGELKDMDNILDEMANRWTLLSRAQQTALAQSVAGVRQYNQLMALMNNWNNGDADSMTANLKTAYSATGALDEQAEIYADSWEAAQDRVSAAAESIYSSLINDDFFITLLNSVEDILTFIDKLIDGLGGLEGVLMAIGALVTKVFANQMAQGLTNMTYNIQMLTEKGRASIRQERQSVLDNAINEIPTNTEYTTPVEKAQQTNLRNNLELQSLFVSQSSKMSEIELATNQILMDRTRILQDQYEQAAQARMEAEEALSTLITNSKTSFANLSPEQYADYNTKMGNNINSMKTASSMSYDVEEMRAGLQSTEVNMDTVNNVTQQVEGLRASIESSLPDEMKQRFNTVLDEFLQDLSTSKDQVQQLDPLLEKLQIKLNGIKESNTSLVEGLLSAAGDDDAKKKAKDISKGIDDVTKKTKQHTKAEKTANKERKNTEKNLNDVKGAQKTWADTLVKSANAAMSFGMALNAISSIVSTVSDAIQEGTFTLSDFTSILMSISMIIPGVIGGYSALKGVADALMVSESGLSNVLVGKAKIRQADLVSMTAEQIAQKYKISLNQAENLSMQIKTATALKNLGLSKATIASMNAETLAEKTKTLATTLGISAEQAAAVIKGISNGMSLKAALSEAGLTVAKGAGTAANWAQVASYIALQIAMSPVLLITLAIVAAIALIAGVVAIIGLIADAYNADAIAAEKANAKLQESKQIVEETTKAYEDLKSAIEDYQDSQKAIETMIEGTQEWKEAIREANLQVLELMNNYPELAEFISKDGSGRLTISQEGLDKVLDAQYAKVAKAQALQSMRQITANQANMKSDRTDFTRGEDVSEATLNKLSRLFSSDMEAYGIELEKVTNGNDELSTKITQLITKEDQLIESNELLKESIVAAYGQTDEHYQNSQYKGYIDYLGGQELEKDSAIYKAEEAEVKKLWDWSNDDFWKAYLEEVLGDTNVDEGSTTGDNYRVTDLGGIGVTLQRKTTEGTWENIGEVDSLAEDKAEEELIQARVAKRIAEKYGEYEEYGAVVEQNLRAAGLNKREGDTDLIYKNRLSDIGLQFVKGDNINLSDLTWDEVESLRSGIGNMGTVINSEGQNFATQMQDALTKYAEQRAEKNLEASSAWLENTEKREAEDLANVLEAAEMDQQAFKNYSKQFAQYGDEAENVAKKVLKTSNAMHSLTTAFEDNEDALAAGEGTAAYASAIGEIQTALTDWLGVDLGYDYVTQHLDEIQQAALGDTEALKALQIQAAKQIVIDMDVPTDVADKLNTFINDVESRDITIGASIDDTNFIATLNDMLRNGQITAEQASAYLNSIGYNPDIDYDVIEQSTEHKYKITDPIFGSTWEGSYTTYSDMKIPVINAEGTKYVGPQSTTTPAMANDSGSSKTRESKNINEELDRYHEIKEIISDLNRELNALSEAKDRAFGANKLALMDAEIAKTQELLNAQRQYVNELQNNLATDQKQLNSYGFATDAQGRITNYEEIFAARLDEYNAAAADKTLSDTEFEEYETSWEDFKNAIEQYEETLNDLEEEQQAVISLQNEMADLALEKIQYEVELKVRLADTEMQWLEYQLENLDDSVMDLAEKLAVLGKTAQVNLDKIAAYETGVYKAFSSILSNDEITALLQGDNSVLNGQVLTDNQVSALEDWRDSLYESNTALIELRTTMHESIISSFEDMNEKMEQSADNIDHLNSVLSSYKDIIDLVGEANVGVTDEIMSTLNDAIVQTSTDAIRVAKATYEMNKAALADAQAARAAAEAEGREEDVKKWDETIQTIQEQVNDSQSELLDQLNNGLQAAADAFEDSVNRAIAAAEKAMSGMYGSFEKLQTAFDQQSEINDRYLDDYQKIYELNKLIRDVNKSIDETDNLKAKKELRNLEKEISAIYESEEEVSQYQVDHMRAQYELRLAQIALEEAQNAKSKVRMRKDSEGNWSYVYTADDEVVDNAVQNYEDKLYELQNLIQEYLQELQENVIGSQADMMSAIQELRVQDFASEQEYQEAVQEIIEYYSGMRKYYMDELNKALADSKEVYEYDWKEYSKYTNYKISEDDKWVKDYKDTTYAIMTGTTTLESDQAQFNSTISGLLSVLADAYEDWSNAVDTQMSEAGFDTEEFVDTVKKEVDKIEGESQRAGDSAKSMADQMSGAFSNIISEMSAWESNYSGYIQKAIDKNSAMIESINAVIAAAARAAATDLTPDVDLSSTGDDSGATGGGTTGGNNTGGNNTGGLTGGNNTGGDKPKGTDYTPDDPYGVGKKGKITKTTALFGEDGASWYQMSNGSYAQMAKWNYIPKGETFTIQAVEKNAKNYYSQQPVGKTLYKTNWEGTGLGAGMGSTIWVTADMFTTSFDTGGYTGAWGSAGRLAMLHQKELVLNAQDTENMLNAVNIIRNISRVIDLNAASSAHAFGTLSTSMISNNGQTVQQEVTIHAEFPYATDHYEIEEAFNTLINQSVQFANRKN